MIIVIISVTVIVVVVIILFKFTTIINHHYLFPGLSSYHFSLYLQTSSSWLLLVLFNNACSTAQFTQSWR